MPEEKVESLKAIHYWIDQGWNLKAQALGLACHGIHFSVPFTRIGCLLHFGQQAAGCCKAQQMPAGKVQNHKSHLCFRDDVLVLVTLEMRQVFRDEADGEDLRLLASECLGVSRDDPASRCLVNGFCKAERRRRTS